MTSWAVISAFIDQPTTLREKEVDHGRGIEPALDNVEIYVKSAIHLWFGRSAANCRSEKVGSDSQRSCAIFIFWKPSTSRGERAEAVIRIRRSKPCAGRARKTFGEHASRQTRRAPPGAEHSPTKLERIFTISPSSAVSRALGPSTKPGVEAGARDVQHLAQP